jgi:hypothetical protein
MGFTTKFGQHSQTTRLGESTPWGEQDVADGVLTLSDAPFQKTWATVHTGDTSIDYNSTASSRFTCWAFPVSLAVTKGILVGFFSSAY